MPTTRATKELALALGISVGTMRNWSDQYATHLSETARPGHLPERWFTDKDLTILTYIKQLRSEGMQAEQIREHLGETTFNDVEIMAQQAKINTKVDVSTAMQKAPESMSVSQSAIRGYVITTASNRGAY